VSGSAGTSREFQFANLHNFILYVIFPDVFQFQSRYYDDVNDDECVCVVHVLPGSPVSGHGLVTCYRNGTSLRFGIFAFANSLFLVYSLFVIIVLTSTFVWSVLV